MVHQTKENRQLEAVFGGGCFWCTEAVFVRCRGVAKVTSGYAGGKTDNPSYDAVCSGRTGHAEVIKVTYDAVEISYADLLEIFFATHDPTTYHRQGNDTGSQYRSIILYATEEQKQLAEKCIQQLERERQYTDPIVTEVVPLVEFYPAEVGHQDYFERNPGNPYCQVVIAPKLQKWLQGSGGKFVR